MACRTLLEVVVVGAIRIRVVRYLLLPSPLTLLHFRMPVACMVLILRTQVYTL